MGVARARRGAPRVLPRAPADPARRRALPRRRSSWRASWSSRQPRRAGVFGVLAARLFVAALAGRGRGHGPLASARGRPRTTSTTLADARRARWPPGRSSSPRRATPGSGRSSGSRRVAVLRAPRTLWLLGAAAAVLLLVRPAAVAEPAHDRGRQQPRPLLHVAGGDRHDPGQAGLRPGAGHDPRDLPALPLAGGAEPARARTCTTTRSRSRPSAACPASCSGSGGWPRSSPTPGARRARGSWPRARPPGARRPPWPCSSRSSRRGLFEYNFGDSEVLMFILLVSALPYALRRERATA